LPHARPASNTRLATAPGLEVLDLGIFPTRITRPTTAQVWKSLTWKFAHRDYSPSESTKLHRIWFMYNYTYSSPYKQHQNLSKDSLTITHPFYHTYPHQFNSDTHIAQ